MYFKSTEDANKYIFERQNVLQFKKELNPNASFANH